MDPRSSISPYTLPSTRKTPPSSPARSLPKSPAKSPLKRLNEEKDRGSTASSRSSATPRRHAPVQDQTIALEQAMLRRQELIDKINNERRKGDDFKRDVGNEHGRPRSYAEARERLSPPPSRRADSQPNFRRKYDDLPPLQHQGVAGLPEGYQRDGGSPRHVIEHQFKPVRLDPLQNAPMYQPPPPPPPPQAQPQYVQTQPLFITSPSMDNRPQGNNTKAEMMELMMMQNAQMHQMMMQQLMMSAIPKPKPSPNVNVDIDEIISLKSDRRHTRERERPPSVHHHHYTPPPPPPPAPMPHYPSYTLPPIQVPPPMPQYYSPRYYDLEPLKQPKDYPSVLHQHYRKQQDY